MNGQGEGESGATGRWFGRQVNPRKVKGLKLKTWSHVSLVAVGGEPSALILCPSQSIASAQRC